MDNFNLNSFYRLRDTQSFMDLGVPYSPNNTEIILNYIDISYLVTFYERQSSCPIDKLYTNDINAGKDNNKLTNEKL